MKFFASLSILAVCTILLTACPVGSSFPLGKKGEVKFTKKPVTVSGVKQEDVSYYFFDTENSLPIATETEIKEGPMKGEKSTSTMSDYQEVDGIFFPFAMNQGGQDVKVIKITLNPVVDQSSFTIVTE